VNVQSESKVTLLAHDPIATAGVHGLARVEPPYMKTLLGLAVEPSRKTSSPLFSHHRPHVASLREAMSFGGSAKMPLQADDSAERARHLAAVVYTTVQFESHGGRLTCGVALTKSLERESESNVHFIPYIPSLEECCGNNFVDIYSER
jgi:hypothetical protein